VSKVKERQRVANIKKSRTYRVTEGFVRSTEEPSRSEVSCGAPRRRLARKARRGDERGSHEEEHSIKERCGAPRNRVRVRFRAEHRGGDPPGRPEEETSAEATKRRRARKPRRGAQHQREVWSIE
jgi:hypothetical protein